MTSLLLVTLLGGWQVETRELVAAPDTFADVRPLDDVTLATLGTTPDGGKRVSLLTFTDGEPVAPVTLAELAPDAGFFHGTGTGLNVQLAIEGELDVLHLRERGKPELVPLGRFKAKTLRAISCTADVRECLVVDDGTPLRWAAGQTTPLFEGIDPEALRDAAEVLGGAMHPEGTAVALWVDRATWLVELRTGRITVLHGTTLFPFANIKALLAELSREDGRFTQRLHEAATSCETVPLGWQNGVLAVGHNDMAEVGDTPCNKPPLTLQPGASKVRAAPPYAWQVLDCPVGGWTSAAGTFVTRCLSPELPRARAGPRAPPDPPLPEALGLSPTQLFVMADAAPRTWHWYRKAPPRSVAALESTRTGGLRFTVEGPSVLTFKPNGVAVERIDWPYGLDPHFDAVFDGDWHLLYPRSGTTPLLLRFVER